jgi:hypothetical protein
LVSNLSDVPFNQLNFYRFKTHDIQNQDTARRDSGRFAHQSSVHRIETHIEHKQGQQFVPYRLQNVPAQILPIYPTGRLAQTECLEHTAPQISLKLGCKMSAHDW